MRTLITVFVVTIIVLAIAGYAVGFFAISSERSPGKYVVSVEFNTQMLQQAARTVGEQAENQAKGRIVSVSPAKNEFVLTQNVKDLTFQLAKDGKVFLNGAEGKLASLQAGDQAVVTYEKQGQRLTASVVRCTRK